MSQKQIEHYIYSTNQPLGEGSTGTVYLGIFINIKGTIQGQDVKLLLRPLT